MKMFTGKAEPIQIIGDPDKQRPDKWSSVLHTVKKGKTFIHTAKRRNEKWIDHILRRNNLLKHVIE
jgi:adenine specific DNA methylase Mod